jgi:tetratricopeptide (TPR) repeat protein
MTRGRMRIFDSVPDHNDELLCNKGEQLMREGRLEEAKRQFDSAIELNRDSARAHAGLGHVFYKQWVAFMESLEDSLKRGILVARVDVITEPIEKLEKHLIDEMESAIRLEIRSDDVHYEFGDFYMKKGQLADAIKQFHEALSIYPTHALASFKLGKCYLHQERYSEAVHHLETAARLIKADPEVHYELARAYYIMERKEESIHCLKKALSLDPKHADVLLGLGTALMETGKRSEAIEIYRRFLILRPSSSAAESLRGRFRELRG